MIIKLPLGAGKAVPYIEIGREGENLAENIVFDFSVWAEEYGSGYLGLVFQRPGDTDPYPVMLEMAGDTAVWQVSAADTAISGNGQAQLTYMVEEIVKKSAVYEVRILSSVTASTTDPPDPIETYLEKMQRAAAQAYASEEAAAASEISAGESARAAAEAAEIAVESASGIEQYVETAAEYSHLSAEAAERAAGSTLIAQEAERVSAQNRQAAETEAANAGASQQAAAASAGQAQEAAESVLEIAEKLYVTDDGNGNLIIGL